MDKKWISAEEAYELLMSSEKDLRLTTSHNFWNFPQYYKSGKTIFMAYPDDHAAADEWESKSSFVEYHSDDTFRIV